ncbi:MAG: hypothetical protein QW514_08620 [Thermoprotei archaeon]
MKTPIIMETREKEFNWPTAEIEEIQRDLFEYLGDYYAKDQRYTKHAIMGPVGKLLTIVESSMFGDNVDSYVGYIANVHDAQSEKRLSKEGMEKLRAATSKLINLRRQVSERAFLKIVRSVDYGVYFLKVKQIAERSAEKREALKQQVGGGESAR